MIRLTALVVLASFLCTIVYADSPGGSASPQQPGSVGVVPDEKDPAVEKATLVEGAHQVTPPTSARGDGQHPRSTSIADPHLVSIDSTGPPAAHEKAQVHPTTARRAPPAVSYTTSSPVVSSQHSSPNTRSTEAENNSSVFVIYGAIALLVVLAGWGLHVSGVFAKMTLGQRLSLGFGALIVVIIAMGGIMVVKMSQTEKSAKLLAEEYVKEAVIGSRISASLGDLRANSRAFQYSGEQKYSNSAQAALTKLLGEVAEADELVKAHPDLEKLAKDLGKAHAAISRYQQLFEETRAAHHAIQIDREALNVAGGEISESLEKFQNSQEGALAAEIRKSAAESALLNRRQKLVYAADMWNLINQARIAGNEAQVTRNTALIEEAQANLKAAGSVAAKVRPMLQNPSDIREVEIVQADIAKYRAALADLGHALTTLEDVGTKRSAAAAELDQLIGAIMNEGLSATEKFAGESYASARFLKQLAWMSGLFGMIGGGVLAWIIARSITRPIGRTTNSLIEQSVRNAQTGVAISAEVGATLSEINAAAEKVNSLIGEIAAAGREQSSGIEQVNTAVSEMDKVTQSNAASAEESAAASEELSSQTLELRNVVETLRQMVGTAAQSDAHAGQRRSDATFDHRPRAMRIAGRDDARQPMRHAA